MDQIVSLPESAKLHKSQLQQAVNSRQEAASSRQKHLEASSLQSARRIALSAKGVYPKTDDRWREE